MVVMQFAFDGPPSNPHRIRNHQRQSVVYVATHDCDTALGWWRTLPKRIRTASGLPGVEPNWELIELALSSRADLAIMQAQDVLGLGSEAQIEPAGDEPGQLGLAARAAPTDREARQATPGVNKRCTCPARKHGKTCI